MGVSEIPAKKKFLRTRFPGSCTFYTSSKQFFLSLNPAVGHTPPPPEKQHALIIDGSINLEPAMSNSTPETILKAEAKGKDPAKAIAREIFYKLHSAITDAVNVSTIVYIFGDTHLRPEIKEDRGTGESAAKFTNSFPIGSASMIEQHKDAIRKKYLTSMDPHVGKTRIKKKKRVNDSESEEEEQAKEEEPPKVDTAQMDKEIAEFSQHKFDCWSDGKEVPSNRLSVYRQLTKHLVEMTKKSLCAGNAQNVTVILDNVVLDKDEYATIKILPDGTVSINTNTHHGICECDQLMIYWIHRLMKSDRVSRFVIDTVDTDMLAYTSMNWESIVKESPEPLGEKMILWKSKCTAGDEKMHGLPPGSKVTNKFFVFDLYSIISKIYDPREWGFLTFVVLGNDFVSKNEMHGLFQATKGGKDGDTRTQNLLELLLSRRGEAPRPLTRFDKVKDARYRDGMEWKITLDTESLVALVTKYRKEDKSEKKDFAGFDATAKDRKKLERIRYNCKNAVYTGEYFLNQWRLNKDAWKMFQDPASNKAKYGYERNPVTRRLIMPAASNKRKAKTEKKAKKEGVKWSGKKTKKD